MDISRIVIGAFVLLAVLLIVAIVVVNQLGHPIPTEASTALYGSLGTVLGGLTAFVHRLPLPAENLHP